MSSLITVWITSFLNAYDTNDCIGLQKERGEMADAILNNRDTINIVVTTYDMAAKKEDNKFLRRLKPDVSLSCGCFGLWGLINPGLCLRRRSLSKESQFSAISRPGPNSRRV